MICIRAFLTLGHFSGVKCVVMELFQEQSKQNNLKILKTIIVDFRIIHITHNKDVTFHGLFISLLLSIW